MWQTHSLYFGPFRLDLDDECLWRGPEVQRLTHKAFAVLRYLVEHAERLVTKDDLLDAVWATTHVSEAALSSCIREVRRVLDDDAQQPQYVETVRGRGYRFVAPVTRVAAAPAPPLAAHPAPAIAAAPGLMVGREAEVAQLQACFAQALQGTRQVVFVTGEAGIGKTTLVDALVAQVASTASQWIGHGQCIEQYGAGEAFLPLLEALGQLGRGADGAHLVEMLRQQAPSWLLQMPALVPAAAVEGLQRQASGATLNFRQQFSFSGNSWASEPL